MKSLKQLFFRSSNSFPTSVGEKYSIPLLDLSQKPKALDSKYDYLYENTVMDNSKDYVGHPDSVLLKNGYILSVYPQGHGKGAILSKLSRDNGASWTNGIDNPPKSWEGSRETPTIYRLKFAESETADKLILIAGDPRWGVKKTKGGFNCSFSDDEGKSWTEFQLFWSTKDDGGVANTTVAMASLTQLKENGTFVDKWMAFFHDFQFHNYKSILTFDKQSNPHWSKPERYFDTYRNVEKKVKMCEVEVIRSDNGSGNQLCLLGRSNSKKNNSIISFSNDEGKTWSTPKEVPASLNGERHKADYTSDGRLFITFRSIERSAEAIKAYADDNGTSARRGWFSEGWIAWVGTYDDLAKGSEGQYRIKIAHTYLPEQSEPARSANADTGYCGNVVLPDDTIVTSTYGCFDPTKNYIKGGKTVHQTSVISKRIRLEDTDLLVKKYRK